MFCKYNTFYSNTTALQYRFGDSHGLFLLRLVEVLNSVVIFEAAVCSTDKKISCGSVSVGEGLFVTVCSSFTSPVFVICVLSTCIIAGCNWHTRNSGSCYSTITTVTKAHSQVTHIKWNPNYHHVSSLIKVWEPPYLLHLKPQSLPELLVHQSRTLRRYLTQGVKVSKTINNYSMPNIGETKRNKGIFPLQHYKLPP